MTPHEKVVISEYLWLVLLYVLSKWLDFIEKTFPPEIGEHPTGNTGMQTFLNVGRKLDSVLLKSFKVPQAPSSFKDMVFRNLKPFLER